MAVQRVTRKTFLVLLTDAIREAGVQQKAPTAVTDTNGIIPRFKQWLLQAYLELQEMKDWGWRRKQTELILVPGARRIDVRDRRPTAVFQVDPTGPTAYADIDSANVATGSYDLLDGGSTTLPDTYVAGNYLEISGFTDTDNNGIFKVIKKNSTRNYEIAPVGSATGFAAETGVAVTITVLAYTDYTTESRQATAGDVQPFPTSDASGDYILIGSRDPFPSVFINTSTAAVSGGTPVITWNYWDGDSWEALTGVSDGTSAFTTTGTKEVTWSTSPTDWAASTINGSEQLYFIQGVVTVATFTTEPLITEIFIGGTEEFESVLSAVTNERGPNYLQIRTLDAKSDLKVVDNDAMGKVYFMPYQQWRGEDNQYYSITAATPTWFTILPDGRLEFNKPANVDYGLTIDYTTSIKEMTADGDFPDIPVELQDILIWLTVLNYMGWDESRQGFAAALRRYKFYMKRMNKDWLPPVTLRPFPLFTNYD